MVDNAHDKCVTRGPTRGFTPPSLFYVGSAFLAVQHHGEWCCTGGNSGPSRMPAQTCCTAATPVEIQLVSQNFHVAQMTCTHPLAMGGGRGNPARRQISIGNHHKESLVALTLIAASGAALAQSFLTGGISGAVELQL
jgi:hypothetical protein